MDLQSMNDTDLERQILRLSQALGGGGSSTAPSPRKLSPQELNDTEWRLRRIEQEMNVLDRPRSYDLPEAAGHTMNRGFKDEGVLRGDELAPRPDAKGWDPDKISPRLAQATGIYALPSGEVTNIGSRGTPAREADPALAQDFEQLEQEKRRLEQAMAGHQEAERREMLAEKGKTPEARPWGETPQGSREKIAGDVIGEIAKNAGKMSKAQEKGLDALYDRKGEIDQILDVGKIEDVAGLRDLTPEERSRLERVSEGLEKKIQRAKGGTPRPPVVDAGGESIKVGETTFLIPNLRRQSKEDPEKWRRAVESGRVPPEVVEAVNRGEQTGTPSAAPERTPRTERPRKPEDAGSGTSRQNSVQAMLEGIREAKEAKDRPRLHQLRKQDPQAYKKAMELYRKESGGERIPGSNLRVENAPGQKDEYDQAWEGMSQAERDKAVEYENQGLKTFARDGKVYVEYMGQTFLVGPKGT